MSSLAQWLDAARTGAATEKELPSGLPSPLAGHAGLWLDRARIRHGATNKDEKHAGRTSLYEVATASLRLTSPAVETYRERFERLRSEALGPSDGERRVLEFHATSRIHLHPATGATVTEGSLLLHHTYGVPYLPGSALKGICRARARRLHARNFSPFGTSITQGRPWYEDLLGFVTEDEAGGSAGLCDFWDALWIPEPPIVPPPTDEPWSPLALDVVTPHHADYYENKAPPLDHEEPVPTQFLTVRPGTGFLVVLETPTAAAHLLPWIVDHLLVPALLEDGVGARTRAGYGRLAHIADQTGGASASSATTTTSRVAPLESPAETTVAQVSFDRGRRMLSALMEDGRPAECAGADVERMFNSLPALVQDRLRRGRSVRLRVTWTRIGRGRRLLRVEE